MKRKPWPSRIEVWGDEGQLHIVRGWRRSQPMCTAAYLYVLHQVGAQDVDEYTEEIKPENVKRGWAIEIPEGHPLNRSREGSIVVSSRLFPPFAILSGPWKGRRVLIGKPATWLYDH